MIFLTPTSCLACSRHRISALSCVRITKARAARFISLRRAFASGTKVLQESHACDRARRDIRISARASLERVARSSSTASRHRPKAADEHTLAMRRTQRESSASCARSSPIAARHRAKAPEALTFAMRLTTRAAAIRDCFAMSTLATQPSKAAASSRLCMRCMSLARLRCLTRSDLTTSTAEDQHEKAELSCRCENLCTQRSKRQRRRRPSPTNSSHRTNAAAIDECTTRARIRRAPDACRVCSRHCAKALCCMRITRARAAFAILRRFACASGTKAAHESQACNRPRRAMRVTARASLSRVARRSEAEPRQPLKEPASRALAMRRAQRESKVAWPCRSAT